MNSDTITCLLLFIETVHNAGTTEEAFSDSVMINARNIKHCELVEPVMPQEQTPVMPSSEQEEQQSMMIKGSQLT